MVDGFWEETIVANGFRKDFYNSTIAIESMVLQSTIGDDGFSMVFDHRTIAIESMVLQSTIGDDGFSMVNEKKRQWFSKIAIYDKNWTACPPSSSPVPYSTQEAEASSWWTQPLVSVRLSENMNTSRCPACT